MSYGPFFLVIDISNNCISYGNESYEVIYIQLKFLAIFVTCLSTSQCIWSWRIQRVIVCFHFDNFNVWIFHLKVFNAIVNGWNFHVADIWLGNDVGRCYGDVNENECKKHFLFHFNVFLRTVDTILMWKNLFSLITADNLICYLV